MEAALDAYNTAYLLALREYAALFPHKALSHRMLAAHVFALASARRLWPWRSRGTLRVIK